MTPAIFWQESTWFTNSECLKLTRPSFDPRKKNVRSCRSDMREIFCRACSNPQEVGRFFLKHSKNWDVECETRWRNALPENWSNTQAPAFIADFYPGLFTNKTENKENYYRLYTQSVSQWKEKNGPTNSSLTNSQNTFFGGGRHQKNLPPQIKSAKSQVRPRNQQLLSCAW